MNPNTTVQKVEQVLVYVGTEDGKIQALRNLINEGITPPVLIFVRSKQRAIKVFRELTYDAIDVDVIHGGRPRSMRNKTVNDLHEGRTWAVVCTDVMGRAIDFKEINILINYDIPRTAMSYIYRIGSIGRAGRPGKAITYFTYDDKPLLRAIASFQAPDGRPTSNTIESDLQEDKTNK